MNAKKTVSLFLIFFLTLNLVIPLMPAFAEETFDYSVKVLGKSDNSKQYNSTDTYIVVFQVKTLGDAEIGNLQTLALSYDAELFDVIHWSNVTTATGLTTGWAAYSSYPDVLTDWSKTLRLRVSADGKTGYMALEPSREGEGGNTGYKFVDDYASLSSVRFGFKPSKSIDDMKPDSIKLIPIAELDTLSCQVGLADGVRQEMYMYGAKDGTPNEIEVIMDLEIPPSPLASFETVTLTQTGSIAEGDVQYKTSDAVIAALPTEIDVTLENGYVVSVPITWTNTELAYDAAVAGDYTFTATWGDMPNGADNTNDLPPPTCTVKVVKGEAKLKEDSSLPTATATYGTALSSITINLTGVETNVAGIWAWDEINAATIYPTVGGETAYKIIFNPNDSEYGTITNLTVVPEITPKALASSMIDTISDETYTGSAIKPDLTVTDGTPNLIAASDYEVSYSYNTDVGTATATITATEDGNYSGSAEKDFTINQATVQSIDSASIPANVTKTAYEVRTDNDITKIKDLANLPATVEVETTNGITATLDISWNNSDKSYNAKSETYIFTGTLQGNTNINANGKTATVTVTITPVEIPVPTFGEGYVIVGLNGGSATAAQIGTTVLPTSSSIVIPDTDVTVEYTIAWGAETLNTTNVGNNTTFTGTVNYTDAPAWATIPTNKAVSRLVTVTNKYTAVVAVTPPANITYGQTLGDPSASATYNGSPINPANIIYTYSGTSIKNGIITPSTTKPKDAGTYTVTATLDDATYAGSAISASFTITQKALTATVNAINKVYGDAIPTFGATYDGFITSDNESSLSTQLTFTTTATATSVVGSYTVTASAGAGLNGNYTVTVFGENKLTITKKPITVTAENKSREYGAANPPLTFTHNAADLVGTDVAAALAVTLSCAATATSPAGTGVAITGTSTSANYNVTVTPGTLTITKTNQTADVIVSLSNDTAVLGLTPPTVSVSGGNGTGAYKYYSSDDAVAEIDEDTGVLTVLAIGTTNIKAKRIGDTNYNDSSESVTVTLTVVEKVELTASNTSASGDHLVNAKNQGKVSFENVTREGETNDFTMIITGTSRLVSYESVAPSQGEGYWVGALIGKDGVNDITDLFVKTSAAGAYSQLAQEDIDESANAGGGESQFVYWFKVTDSGSGSTHTIRIADNASGLNESILTIRFIPYAVPQYTITVTAGTGGTVTGSGTFASGAQVTLKATPNSGYSFDGWYEHNTKVTGADATYTFAATGNRTIEARFTRDNNSGGYVPPYIPPYNPPSDSGSIGDSTPSDSGSSSSGSSGSGASGNNTPASETPVIQINGVTSEYTKDANGNVTLTPTPAQMQKMVENSRGGSLIINMGSVSGATSISFEFSPSLVPKSVSSIKIVEDKIGSCEIKSATISTLKGKVTVVLKMGSLIFDILVDGKAVSVTDYANPMTISMPYTPKSGELASQIVMTNKKTGKAIPRSYYKDGNIYATVYSTGTYDMACIKPTTFTDTVGMWSNESVSYMNTRGVINGVTETTFAPDTKITRAQYITMLIRLLDLTGVNYSGTEHFSDVPTSDFYYTAIMQARALGITNGIGDNKFGKDLPITLEDMYTMTYRAMKQFGMSKGFDKTKGLESFSDGDQVSSYAVEAIQNLLQNNIVRSETALNPKVTASRAITALLMYRLLLSER